MMLSLERVVAEIGGLDSATLAGWIERRWVRPQPAPEGWLFREVDIARVRLIVEIRRDCAVDDEALPLVLSLLDQVYRLRRQLRALSDAVAAQPDPVRDRILALVAGTEGPDPGA